MNSNTTVLLCTIEDLTFSLLPEGSGFRWFNPDTSPTPVVRHSLAAAGRTMMYRGSEIARAYRERTRNPVDAVLVS